MESKKCPECGLVSWIESETIACQRCGGPLWGKRSYSLGLSTDTFSDKPVFSGVLKFLIIVLGLAVLALITHKLFLLGNVSTGRFVAVVFALIGIAFAIFMNICLLIAIFRESVGWGLATLFVPFAGLIALVKFWDTTRRPFLAHLISTAIVVVGVMTGA